MNTCTDKKGFCFRATAVFLVAALLGTSFNMAYAQADLGVIGRQGQDFGNQILGNFNQPSASGNHLNLGGGQSINMNDLYPSTSSENTKPNSYYFPDDYEKNTNYYESIYDSGSSMDTSGSNAQAILYEDAVKDDPDTLQGQAYKIILDTANRSRPDMANDPMFNATRDVVNNMDDWRQNFGDCTTDANIVGVSRSVHVPEYETCDRVTDKSQTCTLNHEYNAGVVEHYSGPLNLRSCGEGCTEIWIGRMGDNYWSGWCTIFEQATAIKILKPHAITKAVLDYVEYDDYMQVYVGKIGQETKVFNGPNSNFPPETAGECELSTSWKQNPNRDVTDYFKVAENDVVNFKIRVSVAGEGEGFGRIKIYYDPKEVIDDFGWSPPDCVDAGVAIEDLFASGQIQCTSKPTLSVGCFPQTYYDDIGEPTHSGWLCSDKPVNAEDALCSVAGSNWFCSKEPIASRECTDINGVRVCTENLEGSPLNSITNLCKRANIESDYDFYRGSMECWDDPNGEPVCPDNDGGYLNTCQELDDDPACGYIKSECVEGAEGKSGQCYVFEDTYDCGYDVDVPNWKKEVEVQCQGPIRCMGTECLDISYSQNNDFGKAAALLNAAQFMAQDMACTGLDSNGEPTGQEDVVCTVFEGKGQECKKAVGGIVNCCKKPSGISFADYISLLMAAPKLDAAIMGLDKANTIRSAYQVLRDPIASGWSDVTQPFTSSLDSVSGVFDTVGKTYDQVVGSLKDGISNLFDSAFGFTATNGSISSGVTGGAWPTEAIVDLGTAPQTAGQQLVNQTMSVISTLSTLYTIYTVAILVIKMIYKCTDKELELNVNRTLKNCTKVGTYCKSKVLGVCIEKRTSYCCFNSPLSRIIQEQARPQLGKSFGSAKNPTCEGLSTRGIEKIDWDRINLDEWLGISQSTGNWISAPNINMPNLTGSGSNLDLGGRIDAEERTMRRFEDTNIDATRYELEQTYNPSPRGSRSD